MSAFVSGTAYPIETLPDDLYDKAIPNRDRWALKSALFWNDCQGWWHENIADYWLANRFGSHIARFWMPEPAQPMTREQVLSEQGMVVCPDCDVAFDPLVRHTCRHETLELIAAQRRLQAQADGATP
ncbi:hypothetical protein ACIPUD_10930 [Bradyrhizobium sp. CAR08]